MEVLQVFRILFYKTVEIYQQNRPNDNEDVCDIRFDLGLVNTSESVRDSNWNYKNTTIKIELLHSETHTNQHHAVSKTPNVVPSKSILQRQRQKNLAQILHVEEIR